MMLIGSNRLVRRVIATALLVLTACPAPEFDLGDPADLDTPRDDADAEDADEDNGPAEPETDPTAPADEPAPADEEPLPTPDAKPECGNAIVEAGEECDNLPDVPGQINRCEVGEEGGFACQYRRYLFVTMEQRAGSAWSPAEADEVCRLEAKAAGLPRAELYRAVVADGAVGPLARLTDIGAPWRTTCPGEPSMGFADAPSLAYPAERPSCLANGDEAPASPDAPFFGHEAVPAMWVGALVAEDNPNGTQCWLGHEVGAVASPWSPNGWLSAPGLPCDAALPVVCAGQ